MSSDLARRLARLEVRWQRPPTGPAFVVIIPDHWPAEDRAALAGGDDTAQAAAVERHTGQRPGPSTTLIVLGYRPDGPQ